MIYTTLCGQYISHGVLAPEVIDHVTYDFKGTE